MGQTIAGRYHLRSVLGVGGMGAVYRAQHVVTEDEVALKLLFPDIAQNPEAVERFLREAKAAARIRHPGVVRVLDADIDPSNAEVYLAMELLEGDDLATVFDRGGVALDRFLDVVIELLDSLVAAHARGFVHRDIKPENIFIARFPDGTSRVKLLDFGIARFQDPSQSSHTTIGTVLGTPYYMAPEQAMGRPVDARADLWSLGALIFHAFVGRPPYDGDNVNMVIASIIYQPVPSIQALRPDLPPALIQVIETALQKDPGSRWASAEAMQTALRQVRAAVTGPVITLSSTLRKRSTRMEWSVQPDASVPARRPNRRLIALGATAVVVSLLVGVAAGMRDRTPPPTLQFPAPATSANATPETRRAAAVLAAPLPVVPPTAVIPSPAPSPVAQAVAPAPPPAVLSARVSGRHEQSSRPPRLHPRRDSSNSRPPVVAPRAPTLAAPPTPAPRTPTPRGHHTATDSL